VGLLQRTFASYHLLIDQDGAVIQLVDFDKLAPHAGPSEYAGVTGLSRFSVGIALVNAMQIKCGTAVETSCSSYYFPSMRIERDEVVTISSDRGDTYWHRFAQEQLNALNGVLSALADQYGVREVIGHEHVSPRRKQDPGPAFPWKFFGKSSSVSNATQPVVNANSE
jgi:N-acetylmuramoyl-L-alanine amidase